MSEKLQNFIIVEGVTAFLLSAVFAHFVLPGLAVILGFVFGVGIPAVVLNDFLEDTQDINWKFWVLALGVPAICAQMGWNGLLI